MPHPDRRSAFLRCPRPKTRVDTVEIGAEIVVLDRWREATVLDAPGAQVWSRLNGVASVEQIVDELSRTFRVDRATIAEDVTELVQHLANLELLDGIEPDPDRLVPDIVAVPVHVITDAGEHVDDVELLGLEGNTKRLIPGDADACLVVNWSPHCGYCTSILEPLAHLEALLQTTGIPLVLFAYGSAEANRTLAELTGWHPRVVLNPLDATNPFLGHGTPAAYHLGRDGTLVSPAARGTHEVLELAARLAHAEPDTVEPSSPAGARTLLQHGGSCAAGTGAEPISRWSGTRVYRIGDHHVGLRYATDATARVLDELFFDHVVDDPAAGHIYTVSVDDRGAVGDGTHTSTNANLLVIGSRLLVRSHYPERVLRALLWQLDDRMNGQDPASDLVTVRATAVVTPVGAALLQPGLNGLEEKLQPAFARYGIAYVDVVNPQLDLARAELVVPEPAIGHDRAFLASFETAPDAETGEPEPVRPGRYPLVGWGATHGADEAVTPFSPAQAAAATLSFVMDTQDQAARVRELGDLFGRIDGFGLWYHNEIELADAVAAALGLR